ncbi:MAG TPA: SDR family oxidoreductase [Acidimicrobiales bacterium]|nr:SDR family oxidoreductase [Acidimicrobiales bacterium]
MRFADDVAVVTGASSGLGRQLAADLARAGATVIGVARREPELAELSRVMRIDSPASTYRVCDLSEVDSYLELLKALEEEFGRIDVLLNVAGHGGLQRARWPDLELVRRVMDINFFSPYASMLAVVPGMRARRHGVVANVVSDDARAPGPGPGDYEASKAALAAATESLSYQVRPDGVHLHVVYPAWMPTAMGVAAVEKGGVPPPPRLARRTPERVSALVLDRLGGSRVEINASALPLVAPVARSLVPWAYHRLRPRF